MTKLCTKCKEIKELTEFSKNKGRPDGHNGICKLCHKQYKHTKYTYEQRRDDQLKTKFDLTLVQYNQKSADQNGVCAICKEPETIPVARGTGTRSLAVDHNHTTSKVRGLLCANCNRALGMFKDSKQLLTNAIKYLGDYDE